MLLFIGVWIFFMRQMQGGGAKALSFGKARTRLISEKQNKITFQDALGDLAAELLELRRVLQELDDLAQLFLGLVDAGHVLERDLVLLLRDQPGARLAEGQRLGAAALHLAHEEDPHADEQQHRDPLQHDGVPRVVSGGLTSILTPLSLSDLTRSG